MDLGDGEAVTVFVICLLFCAVCVEAILSSKRRREEDDLIDQSAIERMLQRT